MLFSHQRDAAREALIRIKICPEQLPLPTIKFSCLQCYSEHKQALMCLFCLEHDEEKNNNKKTFL